MNSIINITKLSFSGLLGIKKSTLIYTVIFVFIYLINPMLLFVLVPFLTHIILMQIIGIEDKSNVEYLYSYLPVSKKEYVLSRYVIGLISLVFSILVFCALLFTIASLLKTGSLKNTLFDIYYENRFLLKYDLGIFSGIFFSSLLSGVIIPLVLKYGSTTANYLGILVMMFLVLLPILLFNDSQKPEIINYVINNLEMISVLSAIVIIFISYKVSLGIYNKKTV